MTSVIGLTVL